MSAYVIFTRTRTLDKKELELYWAAIRETMKGHSIEVLVSYGRFEVLEGDRIEGMVIARFPSMDAAKNWYFSDAYQKAAKHRQKGALYNGLLIEGIA